MVELLRNPGLCLHKVSGQEQFDIDRPQAVGYKRGNIIHPPFGADDGDFFFLLVIPQLEREIPPVTRPFPALEGLRDDEAPEFGPLVDHINRSLLYLIQFGLFQLSAYLIVNRPPVTVMISIAI